MNIAAQVVRVVRGDDNWSSLRAFEIDIRKEDNRFVIGPGLADFSVRPQDLAAGIVKLRDRGSETSEWASFLLGSSLSFDMLEDAPLGDLLLDVLWNLSFGDALTDDQLDAIEKCT